MLSKCKFKILALYSINLSLIFLSNATIEYYFSLVKIIKLEKKIQIKIEEIIFFLRGLLLLHIWKNKNLYYN